MVIAPGGSFGNSAVLFYALQRLYSFYPDMLSFVPYFVGCTTLFARSVHGEYLQYVANAVLNSVERTTTAVSQSL